MLAYESQTNNCKQKLKFCSFVQCSFLIKEHPYVTSSLEINNFLRSRIGNFQKLKKQIALFYVYNYQRHYLLLLFPHSDTTDENKYHLYYKLL